MHELSLATGILDMVQAAALTGFQDPCPACDGTLVRHTDGDQLRVLDLLVRDD